MDMPVCPRRQYAIVCRVKSTFYFKGEDVCGIVSGHEGIYLIEVFSFWIEYCVVSPAEADIGNNYCDRPLQFALQTLLRKQSDGYHSPIFSGEGGDGAVVCHGGADSVFLWR